ncbi:hypothetical protein SDRG_03116 [Saprolegnia diclina VS20]|uniref:WW domain-containing protein n=1 Tax=Saprolegnia diclina (strain VS20) TaxID=1156394 RepID=T0S3R0_SAPDV|nr:hypothetical protein SDRG_03116 [Saprolegnia diclina VS20]EQC39688.1 hypothetical protein SDRG_03116 [Saprolegnia diclina VS20]|eukprot:XP_008606960.1 hypothetical protein SDRG_03116 [Saprolegnia diclina VS20]
MASAEWNIVVDDDGKAVYVHATTGEVSWEAPANTSEWEEIVDVYGSGHTYYVNKRTNESRWELPTEPEWVSIRPATADTDAATYVNQYTLALSTSHPQSAMDPQVHAVLTPDVVASLALPPDQDAKLQALLNRPKSIYKIGPPPASMLHIMSASPSFFANLDSDMASSTSPKSRGLAKTGSFNFEALEATAVFEANEHSDDEMQQNDDILEQSRLLDAARPTAETKPLSSRSNTSARSVRKEPSTTESAHQADDVALLSHRSSQSRYDAFSTTPLPSHRSSQGAEPAAKSEHVADAFLEATRVAVNDPLPATPNAEVVGSARIDTMEEDRALENDEDVLPDATDASAVPLNPPKSSRLDPESEEGIVAPLTMTALPQEDLPVVPPSDGSLATQSVPSDTASPVPDATASVEPVAAFVAAEVAPEPSMSSRSMPSASPSPRQASPRTDTTPIPISARAVVTASGLAHDSPAPVAPILEPASLPPTPEPAPSPPTQVPAPMAPTSAETVETTLAPASVVTTPRTEPPRPLVRQSESRIASRAQLASWQTIYNRASNQYYHCIEAIAQHKELKMHLLQEEHDAREAKKRAVALQLQSAPYSTFDVMGRQIVGYDVKKHLQDLFNEPGRYEAEANAARRVKYETLQADHPSAKWAKHWRQLHLPPTISPAEIQQRVVSDRNGAGDTLLHLAAARGYLPKAKMLISLGANVNLVDNSVSRLTPLHEAASAGNANMVKLLLSAGADWTIQDASGDLPLHLACRGGFSTVVKVLLHADADLYSLQLRNFKGKTPLHIVTNPSLLHFLHELVTASQQRH